jgi:hypothetical protein
MMPLMRLRSESGSLRRCSRCGGKLPPLSLGAGVVPGTLVRVSVCFGEGGRPTSARKAGND